MREFKIISQLKKNKHTKKQVRLDRIKGRFVN